MRHVERQPLCFFPMNVHATEEKEEKEREREYNMRAKRVNS